MAEKHLEPTTTRPRMRVIRVVSIVFVVFFIILASPFALSVIENENMLANLVDETRAYIHLEDSSPLGTIALVGNFAGASNSCDFVVADIRESKRQSEDIRAFYTPLLEEVEFDEGPPYHEIFLFIFSNPDDRKFLERRNSEVYWQVVDMAEEHENIYILLSSRAEYPPNFDGRCH